MYLGSRSEGKCSSSVLHIERGVAALNKLKAEEPEAKVGN